MLDNQLFRIKYKIKHSRLAILISVYSKISYNIRKKVFGNRNSRMIESSSDFVNKLHNIYQGKRCFIIGNGPSLNVKDLDLLKNDVCFGCNKIFALFKETQWRPTCYCITDTRVLAQNYDEIVNLSLDYIFFAVSQIEKYPVFPKSKKNYFINFNVEKFYPKLPKFSDDITQCAYRGGTVTYFALQVAVYMGFNEIYLVGVDHNYSVTVNSDGKIERNETVKDHFYQNDVLPGIPDLQQSTLAYKAAKKYADEHGIKIYNATRGGKLEVFERVDLDSLFPNVGNKQ